MFTTTTGMYKLAQAILNGRLLSKKKWEEIGLASKGSYAKGFFTTDVFGMQAMGHNGETSGFLSQFIVVPADSTVIILLSNDTESEIVYAQDCMLAALYEQHYVLPNPNSQFF